MAQFIPGLQLARSFYAEAVRPLLREHFADFEYSAALIGSGSEVLGLDSARSMDHHWGPRLMLFTSAEHAERYSADVHERLAARLPLTFRGIPTNFGAPDDEGTRLLVAIESPPVDHRVDVVALTGYLHAQLGFDPRNGVSTSDWLFTPSQRLLEMTSGDVFDDPAGELASVREPLAWYPRDVWLFLVARQWQRVSQEEAFVGRCAEAGDEPGSRVVAARLVRDLMRLCFLMEQRYAPYSKWLGTAFARLRCGRDLVPIFERALNATVYAEREAALVEAYEYVASMYNALGVTATVDGTVRTYWGRPYRVLHAERFVKATLEALDAAFLDSVAHIPGGIDQIVDNTDVLSRAEQWRRIADGYANA